MGYAALAAAHDGRRIEALRIAHRLASTRESYDGGRTTYARARLAMALGDRRAALTLLGQAMREGVPYNTALHVDPELAPLRGDPAFETMLRGHR